MADEKHITPDVIAVYNEHVAVITEIKRSQWQITNYLLLVFGAVLALRSDLREALREDHRLWLGLIGPILLWLGGAIVLWKQFEGLKRRRERVSQARSLLTPFAREVYGIDAGLPPSHQTDLLIVLTCLGVTLAGAALSALLLSY